MLVGIALEQGRIKSLSQTIDELLPAANDLLPGAPVHAMTLEQILTGTSGLRYDYRTQMRDLDTADDPVAFALGLGIGANGPGRWRYNDAAVSLLSPILRHANEGMPVEQIAQHDLFGPLGIGRFDAMRDKAGNVLAYRGLRLRVRDMAKLAWTMADGGRWGGRQVVPVAWVADSTRMHVRTDWSVVPIRPTGYGYLWFTGELNGHPVAWAWGYGAQFALIAPSLKLAIVTTASSPRPADLGAQNDAVMGIVARIVALA